MPNPIWKGQISFGLVSIPIILYSAENRSTAVSFKRVDKRNGALTKNLIINAENGKEVPWSEVARGYKFGDEILMLDDNELKRVAGENAKTIAIEAFVNAKHLNFLNVDAVYYLVPDKKAHKGYVILREALAKTNQVGIAKVIISTKEYLAAVGVMDKALVIYRLRYDDEIRKMDEFDFPSKSLSDYKVSKKEIEIAEQLINSMSDTWKPEEYKDEYKEAVHKWVENKVHHRPQTKMKTRAPQRAKNVVDFVDLLRQSLPAKGSKNDRKFSKAKNDAVLNKRKRSAKKAKA